MLGASSPGSPASGVASDSTSSQAADVPDSPAHSTDAQTQGDNQEATYGEGRTGGKVVVEELALATSNIANAMVRESVCVCVQQCM